MARINVIKTMRNTIVDYDVSTVSDRKSSIAWIIKVIKSTDLSVYNISLDDLTRSHDEGNSTITIDSAISENALEKKCVEYETDMISVNAEFKSYLIVFGVDLRNFKPFITLENNKMPNLDELEKKLGL